ncbi:MAG: amidohydrolase [Hyphomicrobiaceae bacterium]|nr:amidohydrolase [Hyphomicrobiaceae bacterium]
MPVVNRVAAMQEELAAWRRDLHANPEVGYDVQRTAGIVAEKLRAFGCDEVVAGIGRTGVVGVIRGRGYGSGRVIGLRADMDALPIKEITGLPYASRTAGRMHACGHDGHTVMLLGAARYLCETRNFAGDAVLVFQPAEEGGAGAKAMLDDGLLERWRIQQVYGMHNMPGIPVGQLGITKGPIMAAADRLYLDIEGRGSHAAKPHLSIDPVLIGCQFGNAVQAVVARNVDPLEAAVVSICMFHAGDAFNVIPQTASLVGTIRTLKPEVRERVFERLTALADGLGRQHDARLDLKLETGYPATVNHAAETDFAAEVAQSVAGAQNVDTAVPPMMGGEDFAFMLQERPGAFIFIGNGDSAGLHNPGYDFADAAIPVGVSYWVRLIESAMPA